MKPVFVNGNVRADCPDCGAPTTFEYKAPGGGEFGTIAVDSSSEREGKRYSRIIYKFLRCAVCERPGTAKILANDQVIKGSVLDWFWPTSTTPAQLPSNAPAGIIAEFREAEKCMSVEAWRAAAALLRSALEKVLKANGYQEKDLYKKIEAAGQDGVITSARRQRAQDLVRTLGNDVLHEEWREVTEQEVEDAHHYVGRVIEDFYDDRGTVETVLVAKSRSFTPGMAEEE
jgi:hypothetical protein